MIICVRMHIGSCFFMGWQYNNDNSILFGSYVIKEKQTLFNYLYESLKKQTLTGRLQYGEKIPSMNSLCEFYHLGICIVKNVMRALKLERKRDGNQNKTKGARYWRQLFSGARICYGFS